MYLPYLDLDDVLIALWFRYKNEVSSQYDIKFRNEERVHDGLAHGPSKLEKSSNCNRSIMDPS